SRGDGAAGWLFRPGDAGDLRSALETAAGDEAARTERGLAARRLAAALDWREAAVRFASLLAR
ncbi:MAG: glycogen synthase, partial [Gemmatimonadota bacterium]